MANETTTIYDLIGGESTVRALTRRFYALMDSDPAAAAARAIHPDSLVESEEKLFEFMTGWLGGPPLFTTRRGPPMLRARHLHAPIGEAEIEGWLHCFRKAWAETVTDPRVGDLILPRIEGLARHMHNRG